MCAIFGIQAKGLRWTRSEVRFLLQVQSDRGLWANKRREAEEEEKVLKGGSALRTDGQYSFCVLLSCSGFILILSVTFSDLMQDCVEECCVCSGLRGRGNMRRCSASFFCSIDVSGSPRDIF